MEGKNVFALRILTATREMYSGNCKALIINEKDGQKEILANHENMVISVEEGEIRFQKENSDEWIRAISGKGFAEIINNSVILLLETAEKPEEIDVARAKRAKERAEEQLRQKQSLREYYHTRASLARALGRIKEAKR